MELKFNEDIYSLIKVSDEAMTNAPEDEFGNNGAGRLWLKFKPRIPIICIWAVWVLFIILIVIRVINITKGIYYLDSSVVNLSPFLNYFCVLGPIFLWVGQTVTEHFGIFKVRKYSTLCVTLFSIGVFFFQLFFGLGYYLFVPLIFKLPVTVDITKTMIVNLARGVLFICTMGVPLVFTVFIMRRVFAPENRDMINSFRLNRHFDLRKNKKFKYDARYVKRVDDGRVYTIKEHDRYLHTLLDGTTGTAKTSAAMSPAIVGDLNQRAFNEDYVKERFLGLVKSGDLKIKESFDYFSFDKFEPVTDKGKMEYEKILKKAPIAGITLLAPNSSLGDTIYNYAYKRGMKVNRIDPVLDANERHKPGFIGFNPLYIDPEVRGLSRRIEINAKACLFADVLQAVYDAGSKGDPYFSSVNRNVTTSIAILLLLTFEGFHGRQPNPADIQDIINDFGRARDYFNALKKMENNSDYQFIIDFVGYHMLGEGAKEMNKHASGLKMLINDLLINPLFKSVLCAEESIDIDKALRNGEITIVNYATELGMSQAMAFGMFFAFTFNNAVIRRPGPEDSRSPHFYFIDEFPVLLHARFEQMFTYYRQFRVGSCVAIQTLDQMRKNPSTAYFESILLGNTAHQMFYGRLSPTEMEIIQKMGGEVDYVMEQNTVSETSITSDNPQYSYSTRETVQKQARLDSTKARYQDFMQVYFFTVDNGTPIPPFHGKVNFVEQYEKVGLKRYNPSWDKYFPKYKATFISSEDVIKVYTSEQRASSDVVRVFNPDSTLFDLAKSCSSLNNEDSGTSESSKKEDLFDL